MTTTALCGARREPPAPAAASDAPCASPSVHLSVLTENRRSHLPPAPRAHSLPARAGAQRAQSVASWHRLLRPTLGLGQRHRPHGSRTGLHGTGAWVTGLALATQPCDAGRRLPRLPRWLWAGGPGVCGNKDPTFTQPSFRVRESSVTQAGTLAGPLTWELDLPLRSRVAIESWQNRPEDGGRPGFQNRVTGGGKTGQGHGSPRGPGFRFAGSGRPPESLSV